MNERSKIRALLRQVQALAEENSPRRVLAIRVRVGDLCGVETGLLSEAYGELVRDTPLRGAALELERVPREAICDQCGNKFRIIGFHYECDKCGSLRLSLRGGDELRLDSVKFEENKTMNTKVLTQTLKDIRFLHDIAPQYLEQIAAIAETRDFDEHDVVFREGQIANSLYLVAAGKVSLQICRGGTGTKHIVTVGPGELLGWSSLSDRPEFAATAVALERTHVIRIDGHKLRAICDEDPRFGYEFMRRTMLALAKRLTATWTQLSELHMAHYAPMAVGAAAENE
jgi:CRP/FNR family cyclic AMP-dependent transcriptional regulator